MLEVDWLKSREWEIREWWFDKDLSWDLAGDYEQKIEAGLKYYYAYLQVFHHDKFRKSNSGLEMEIRKLISKVEKDDEFESYSWKNKRLRALVLGAGYRRLGQFKNEHYQDDATEEYGRADHYLEEDNTLFSGVSNEKEEDFIITLLFLLNKAKYFRDIANIYSADADVSYWRSIVLFQETVKRIEKRRAEQEDAAVQGVIARVYLNAKLNIGRVYRMMQKHEKAQEKCAELVSFCVAALGNSEEIDKIIMSLPEIPKPVSDGFSVKEYEGDRDIVTDLLEDYILQALVQLGISYRDCVDFNISKKGKELVRKAVQVFLALECVDRIKSGEKGQEEKAKMLLDNVWKWDLGSVDKVGQNENESFFPEIRELVEFGIKNEDAKNNLAICLKKLGYYTVAIEMLETMEENRFAEYNLRKCYLELGAIEDLEEVKKYCCEKQEINNGQPYVNLDSLEKSSRKWLFLYARCLLIMEKYEEAERLFGYIHDHKPIRWDSLELKAAYLEAQCLIRREKYLRAIDVLMHIRNSLLKLDAERHEIRTEIDLGWCWIMEDGYQEALDVYLGLLGYLGYGTETGEGENNGISRRNAVSWDDVDEEHQRRILHNLYECWSHLRIEGNTHNSVNDQLLDRKMKEIVKELQEPHDGQDKWFTFLQCLQMLKEGKEQPKGAVYWEDVSGKLKKVLESYPQNTVVYSCWAISKATCCLELFGSAGFETAKTQLLMGLATSTTPITMKGYIEVAKIILSEKDGRSFLRINSENRDKEEMKLERSFLELFCGVKLLKNGTNQAFMNLMTNDDFHSIEITARARLLAMIVGLYGDVLQIKNQLRVKYDYVREHRKNSDRNGKGGRDGSPIAYQYTKLGTLKCILRKKEKLEEIGPCFRLSNVAKMNDTQEGSAFRKVFRAMAKDKNHKTYSTILKQFGEDRYEALREEIIRNYMGTTADFGRGEEISVHDSDVYIGCFSEEDSNFGLWSNYADNEKGCIIGFDESFFDFVDKNTYSLYDDEAEENALYRILYVDEKELDNDKRGIVNEERGDIEIINNCIPDILLFISKIEKELEKEETEEKTGESRRIISLEAAEEIRAFIADRLNEIRFLFKSSSYKYEKEMRMLRCSHTPLYDESGEYPVPRLYINVEKELKDLTLIVGSKVDRQMFKELSVWAKSTGRVKKVVRSELNYPG